LFAVPGHDNSLPHRSCPVALSLPRLFGTTLANVPARVPYLTADPRLVDRWRQELAALPGFKVGIAWQGSPTYGGDRHRSIPLAQFAPLARIKGVRLYSLQKGYGAEQLAAVKDTVPVVDFGERLDAAGAFLDTAALMQHFDLVITSDTAVAHLAGALGVPVWVALPCTSDWRWLRNRADGPWYPTMRLYRQTTLGEWRRGFETLAAHLEKLSCRTAAGCDSVLVETAPGELIDKITILQIKTERNRDPEKVRNVRRELSSLEMSRDRAIRWSDELSRMTGELKQVNEALWEIEDDIRSCERARDYGEAFVRLARSVYHQNDRRAALKRKINETLGSRLREEKSYTPYT
jgi:hypothetical protein